MRTLRIALLAAVATAAFAPAAMAADLILDPPAVEDQMIDNSVGWDGVYVGGLVSLQDVPSAYGAGVVIGVNATSDALLFGAELEGSWLSNNTWSAQVDGRVGALLTDSIALYGFAGLGTNSATDGYVPVGVGAEFMVSDSVSFKTEYQYNWDFDNAAEDSNVLKAGINFHF
ncbi:MAG: hypothetical protein ABL879_12670 [Devosia sp.]